MTKTEIIKEMRVISDIDVTLEINRRIEFIKKTLVNAGLQTLVLGVSGGIDSTTLGRLAQLSIDELNQADSNQTELNQNQPNKSMKHKDRYRFIAVRLPYGTQADEQDAQLAITFIQPTESVCVNIKTAVDRIHIESTTALQDKNLCSENLSKLDFVKGNSKARTRMIAQYEIAGLLTGLVLGTDHSAENITGFYTKWGDGACDLAPLFGLSKRQVKSIAQHLGAPQSLVNKAPTADLECLSPEKTDEDALGLSYQQIDDFLENKSVDNDADRRIIEIFQKTQHKRLPIPTLYD